MRMQRTYCDWNIENDMKAVLKIKLCMNFLLKSFIVEQSRKPPTLYFLNKQINDNVFHSYLSFYVDVIAYIIKCNYLSVTFLVQNYFGY